MSDYTPCFEAAHKAEVAAGLLLEIASAWREVPKLHKNRRGLLERADIREKLAEVQGAGDLFGVADWLLKWVDEGAVAQPEERRYCKADVAGSTPAGSIVLRDGMGRVIGELDTAA